MGQGRPITGGANYGAAHARIDLDLSSLTSAESVAKAAGDATAKAINQALKIAQNEQKITLESAKQATAAVQAQQAQITATTRAESQERIQAARAEAQAATQQARVAATAAIEEERRKTIALRSEMRARSSFGGSFARGVVGAALGGIGGPAGAIAGALSGGEAGIPIAVGIAGAQAGKLAIDAAQAASDLTESLNKTNVAFGDSSDAVKAWSEQSASAFGQSRRQALEAASSFGLLFREVGLGTDQSAQMSKRLVELAADIASMNNIDPSDALEKLRSGLVGEVRPLRDVGILLNDDVVKRKAVTMGLAANTNAVTDQEKVMARYQLILEQTVLTQGDFARTSGELANKQRIAAAGTEDLKAKFGELSKPLVDAGLNLEIFITALTSGWLDQESAKLQAYIDLWHELEGTLRNLPGLLKAAAAGGGLPMPQGWNGSGQWAGGGPVGGGGGGGGKGGFGGGADVDQAAQDAQNAVKANWYLRGQDINQTEAGGVRAENNNAADQVAKTVANYNKQITREAEDFGRQRVRAEEDIQQQIANVMKDEGKQRAREERDLNRQIAQEQADAAEKVQDIRKDSVKRIQEIEEDYADQRAKAAKEHSNNLLDAAGELDAKAVYQEQRNYAEQAQDAKKAHDKQLKDNKDQLQERLDDEAQSLAKSIRQQREALAQKEADQTEDDAQRIQDMQTQFAKEQAQSAADRGVRLQRMAEDEQDQLNALGKAHSDRIQQIHDQAASERIANNQEFDKDLAAVGIKTQRYIDYTNRVVDEAIKAGRKYIEGLTGTKLPDQMPQQVPAGYASGGWVNRTQMALVHQGEYVIPAPQAQAMSGTSGRSFSFGNISINIQGGANMGPDEFEERVYRAMNRLMEGQA